MKLAGSFTPPGDKSVSHRIGLFSLLGKGRCLVEGYSPCQDCATTLSVVQSLGVGVEKRPNGLMLTGAGGSLKKNASIDCGNSGTTMRLLLGILAGVEGSFILDGDSSLRKRPMERVAAPLRKMGAEVRTTGGCPPVMVEGQGLHGEDHVLPVASAQLKSALLLAGITAKGRTSVAEPAPSRDHTERMLAGAGAGVAFSKGVWSITGPASFNLPGRFYVPKDPSSAAFFLCAAAFTPGSRVTARGVLLNPTRLGFLEVLKRMGALVRVEEQGDGPEPWGSITVEHGPELRGCVVEPHEIPLLVDEVPILALTAARARGETVFQGVEELRVKESDRVGALVSQLGAMGADIMDTGRDLAVNGPGALKSPGRLDSFGDHRIAMTLTMAGLIAQGDLEISGQDCAAVSYPDFMADLKSLLS